MPRTKPVVVEHPLKPDESDLITIDATLMIALDTPKDRAFILDIEAMLIAFIQNPRMERTELEPINSYYRLLVHRIARYYGVEHTIESTRPAVLLLSKTLESKMPLIRLFELVERIPMPLSPASPMIQARQMQQQGPMRIMRREAPVQSGAAPHGQQRTPMQPHVSVETRQQEYEQAKAKIFEEIHEKKVESVDKPASVVSPAMPEARPVPTATWKLDAPEFDPFSTSIPLSHHPIFTKPVINFDLVHMPRHIVLIRVTDDSNTAANATVLQPLSEVLTSHLGQTWEIRTKPAHKDALLICASSLQAEAVLNEAAFRVPGVTVIPWKPRFFAEP